MSLIKRIAKTIKTHIRLIILAIISIGLIALLIMSQYVNMNSKPIKKEEVAEPTPQVAKVMKVGENEIYTRTIAKAINKNEIHITAQTSGVINKIKVKEGDDIRKAEVLVEITDTYLGGNFFDDQLKLSEMSVTQAQINLDGFNEVYDEKKDLAELPLEDLEKQLTFKDVQLTNVKRQIVDSENLLEDIEDLSDDIDDDMPDGIEKDAKLVTQESSLVQLKSGLDTLKLTQSQLEYALEKRNPTRETTELNKDISLQQLEDQQKLLELALESAKLNYELKKMQIDLRTVKAPIAGRIEKLTLREKQPVNAGQEILVLSGEEDMILTAKVSADVADQINEKKSGIVEIDGKMYKASIDFVSSIPIQGNFYDLFFKPETDLKKLIRFGSTVDIKFPINTKKASDEKKDVIYVPIDSVFKTNTEEFVLVAEGDTAVQRSVVTGKIIGDQIEIISGLNAGDLIIIDRSIIAGQKITVDSLDGEEEKKKEEKNPSPTPEDKKDAEDSSKN